MSGVITAALRELMAAGITGEALLAAAERIEAAQAPARTARQNRNARYYQSHKDEIKTKASERRLKRLNASEQDAPVSPLDGPPAPDPTPPLIPLSDEGEGARAPEKPTTSAKRREKGHRIPADDPNLRDYFLAYATKKGFSHDGATWEFGQFRDHWLQSDFDSAWKLSWQAASRTWVRKALARGGVGRPGGNSRGNGHAAGSILGAYQRAAHNVSVLDKNAGWRPH